MEQKEDHQPIQMFGSFSRFRARRKQQFVAQDSDGERSSVWNEGMCSRVSENDEENVILKENDSSVKKQQWTQGRLPLIQIRDENNVVTECLARDGFLGTQSAKKQYVSKSNINYRKAHLRRSCAPRFMNTESVSPRANGATPYGKTSTLLSSVTQSSRNQGIDSENAPEKSVGSNFGSRFVSGIDRRRRRSRLLRQVEGLESAAKNNKNEDCFESTERNEDRHERIPEDEEKTTCLIFSHLTGSRMRMDNQQEAACENKSEGKSRFSMVDRGSRSNVTRRRSIFEIARQRAQSSQPSVEEPTASGQRHIVPLEQEPGNSVHRSHFGRRTSRSSLGKIVQQKNPVVTGEAVGDKSQECRRILEFESGDESEDTEDHTAPLTMMIQTPIIMRASVLQNPVDQKQQKEVCEPVIKKSLFDDSVKTSRFRKRWSTRISQQLEDNSGQSHQNKELKVSTFGSCISNKSDNSPSEALFGYRKEPKTSDFPSHILGNKITVKECHTLQEPSTTNCTSITLVKKGNSPAHPGSTKRIQRRRSAAVLCVRTPLRRKTMNSEARSTNKLISSSVSSKVPAPKGSQDRIRLRRSVGLSRQSVQPQTTVKMATSDNEGLDKEKKIQNDVTSYKSHKVDASTNTTINLANIKHVDFKVLEDIENILKEQEELNTKAVLLQEKTTARRLEMKKKRLMESFMTSISPLRRLKTMFSETHVDESEAQLGTKISRCGHSLPQLSQLPRDQCLPSDDYTVAKFSSVDRYGESPEYRKGEGEDGVGDDDAATQEPSVSSDQSEIEWASPKAPHNIKDHQIQWRRRRQGNRLTRTYQEPIIKEEEFSDACQEKTSPFTTLVGDCERPSLAPMTPHSRQNVCLLKLSLKHQLEQLYDG